MNKYIGVDQYGNFYEIEKHPRKELMEQIDCKHANRMYTTLKSGVTLHIGYVIKGLWITVLGLEGVKFAKEV